MHFSGTHSGMSQSEIAVNKRQWSGIGHWDNLSNFGRNVMSN